MMSSADVSPCVTQTRMTSLPSNTVAAIHARPEARTRSTIDWTWRKPGGGLIHSTASGELLAIDHPRLTNSALSNSVSSIRTFHVLAIPSPSGRCQRQKHAQTEESPRPLN